MGDSVQAKDRGAGAGLPFALGAALSLGLIVAVGVAVVEWAAVMRFAPRRELHGALPWELAVGALGERAVTYAILLGGLLSIVALVHHAVARRPRTSPVPVLAFAAVLCVGVVVGPAALELTGRGGLAFAWGVRAVALLAAVVVWALSKRFHPAPGLVRIATAASLAALLASGAVFVRSPWFDAGRYALPRTERSAPVPAERPNVLVVVLDTLRADRMSVYGWSRPTTPFLESFGRRAIVFDRAIAEGTWTLPSHASLFTGHSVRRHGAGLSQPYLDGRLPTLAESLAADGYATASFSSNAMISRRTGLDRGFERSQALSGVRAWSTSAVEHAARAGGIAPLLPWHDPDDGAALANTLVAGWLDERRDVAAPFFLYVNYLEAHLPWRAPTAFRRETMDGSQVRRSYAIAGVEGGLMSLLNDRMIREGADVVSEEDAEILRLQYEAAIRYLDHRVEELLGLLEDRGLLENTLVVITSDHGEHLGTHGMWSHLLGAFNDLTHIPLLVREPGRSRGVRVDTPVQLSDVHATVLAITGVEDSGGASAFAPRDLIALAAGRPSRRIAISQAGDMGARGSLERQREQAADRLARLAVPVVTAQDERFKYVEWESGARQLYDLGDDPGEKVDVATAHPEVLDRMVDHLRRFRADVPEYAGKGAVPPENETTELLRDLGYVE